MDNIIILTTKNNVMIHIDQVLDLCSKYLNDRIIHCSNMDHFVIQSMKVTKSKIGNYCQSLLDYKEKRNTPKELKHKINLTLLYVTEGFLHSLDLYNEKIEIIGIDPVLFEPEK